MAGPPQAVLSEHFQERMRGKRLHSAVFTTFRFEPDFFETEVLPVFIDAAFSHVADVRLAQLEDALRELPGHIAVYYDQRALVIGKHGARLDVARIPLRLDHGACFHPKNVLALVEDVQPDENGLRRRSLLCACMSANLTEAGWWRNVEVAHVEEIAAGEQTRLRDPLIAWLQSLAQQDRHRPHAALDAVTGFLKDSTTQRLRRSANGRFFTHLHYGTTPVPDFLAEASGGALHGWNLEVLSPYFDTAARCLPAEALLRRFAPPAMRVLLPCNEAGQVQCDEALYRSVAALRDVTWASLPKGLLADGSSDRAKPRTVHAKVYRFFQPKPGGREVLYVGSANLTQAGCGSELPERAVCNWESGFLVEREARPGVSPEWWLGGPAPVPVAFAPAVETEGVRSTDESRLQIVHSWSSQRSKVYWNGTTAAPELDLHSAQGAFLFSRPAAPAQEWIELGAADSLLLERNLVRSSLIEVRLKGADAGGLVLVQEEDMAHKPSLVFALSPADILRYWAALTAEQRNALKESQILAVAEIDDPHSTQRSTLHSADTLFDRYAGIFHAFHCLEQNVHKALQENRTRDADYRLFGRKYDSLPTLLDGVCKAFDAGSGDLVEHYVTLLCARQLLDQLRQARADSGYWAANAAGLAQIEALLARSHDVRRAIQGDDAALEAFIAWFEPLFLQRRAPVAEASA